MQDKSKLFSAQKWHGMHNINEGFAFNENDNENEGLPSGWMHNINEGFAFQRKR